MMKIQDEMHKSESNTAFNGGEKSAFMAEPVQNPEALSREKDRYHVPYLEPVRTVPRVHPSVGSNIKRALDIIIAILGLLIFGPVIGLIYLLIAIDSPGRAIFRQERVGLNGKRFEFYKFRSMYENVSSSVHKSYIKDLINGEAEAHPDGGNGSRVYKLSEDSRVTRIGRIIRRTSLDELPQLINVLKNEMSIVGPRPAIPYEVDMYKDWYKRRLAVRPGITGLWQVSGRSERTFEEMIQLDLDYIEEWSLLGDLKIIWQTVFMVLKRTGAW